MNPDQAFVLSQQLCAAFPPQTEDTVSIYAREIAASVDGPAMKRAVERAIKEKERFPRIAQILGIYREERRRVETAEGVPCAPCQREGGYRLSPGGSLHPPCVATAPYLPVTMYDAGKPAWPHEPMCPTHGRAYVASLWRRVDPQRLNGPSIEDLDEKTRAKQVAWEELGGRAKWKRGHTQKVGDILTGVKP